MTTQLFTSAYQIILAKRTFRFHTDYKLLLRLLAFIVLVAAGSLLISRFPVFWIYSFGMYLLFGLLLAAVLGLMKVRSVWEIVLYDK